MKTKQLDAVIERSSDGGYGVYCPDLEGISLYGYGLSEDEAKKNLRENLESIIEYYEEDKIPMPEMIKGEILFNYKYDFSGFFKAYPIFNVSELAIMIGINSSLMRKYKNGLAFASTEQRKKIESGIHSISKKLSTVRF